MVLRLVASLALSAFIASSALAQGKAPAAAEKKATPQQERMKKCNADAKGMKGDERKKFMSACLSDKAAAAAPEKKPTAQQDRMKKCNAEAKSMKGDERKKFMSTCLKG
ncbi:MAG: hypothetical protein HY661_10830 [Betaproteobacteria bacterium]|nr:hypothetical protein [Betaproteobacteria bacterium]